jgi:hypothetical protein
MKNQGAGFRSGFRGLETRPQPPKRVMFSRMNMLLSRGPLAQELIEDNFLA